MMKKKALITGITGQDGSYLAELLLKILFIGYGELIILQIKLNCMALRLKVMQAFLI